MMKKHSVLHLFGQRKQRRPKKQLEGPFFENRERLKKMIVEVDIFRERVFVYMYSRRSGGGDIRTGKEWSLRRSPKMCG